MRRDDLMSDETEKTVSLEWGPILVLEEEVSCDRLRPPGEESN